MIALRFPPAISSILRYVWLVVAVGWSSPSSAVARHWETYVGEATDLDSGEWRYRERHWVQYAPSLSQRLVIYECADGRAFARKWLDYRRSSLAPDFVLQDVGQGTVEGAIVTTQRASSFRLEADGSARVHVLPTDAVDLIDAGFDVWIASRWGDLIDGEPQRIPLLIPSRGESYEFAVQRRDVSADSPTGHVLLQARLANWFGFWLPKIEVTYRQTDRWLTRFEGPTNLRGADNRPLNVRIDFPELPKDASAKDWTDAFTQPLETCQRPS